MNYHSYHSHFSHFPNLRLSCDAALDGAECAVFQQGAGLGWFTTLITHTLIISRTRISCLVTLDEAARASFSTERRIKFTKATRFHKSFVP